MVSIENKLSNIAILLICYFLFFGHKAWGAEYLISQITNNEYLDAPPKISNGQIVWIGCVSNFGDYEVFLYKNRQIIRITNDVPWD